MSLPPIFTFFFYVFGLQQLLKEISLELLITAQYLVAGCLFLIVLSVLQSIFAQNHCLPCLANVKEVRMNEEMKTFSLKTLQSSIKF